MVSFNQIPDNIRIPFAAVEFDSSKAQQGPSLLTYKALLIGQKVAAGSQAADTIVKCTSVENAIALAGRGSMLHQMAIGWFANNKSTELWLGVLADNAGGVAATGTILINTAATGPGTLMLYLGGVPVPVSVAAGDSAIAIATSIVAAVTANPDLPVTAASGGTATVTLTFRHKGLAGNSYDVRANFYDGDALPAGVTLTITAMGSAVAGTLNPVLTNLIAAMADVWFHIWAHPYTDATSLTAIETELETRNGPMVQKQGLAITSAYGTFSALGSLGVGRNSKHSCIFAQTGPSPVRAPARFAAAIAGVIAQYGAADPGRPFQTLTVADAIGTAETATWMPTERNLLLYTGIATTKRMSDGSVTIDRAITTYETSASGAADTAYLDATTLLTLMYLRFSFVNRMLLKYPRHKLAADADAKKFGSGQAVMTPLLGKAEAVAWFEDMLELALVENLDQFKRDLVVVRNSQNPNRLDFLLPPDLINALVLTATQIQFLL